MRIKDQQAFCGHVVAGIAATYAMALTYLLLAPVPLWFLGQPGGELQQAIDSSLSDLIQHATAYGLLGVLAVWAVESAGGPRGWLWLAAVPVHGMAAEILQYFVPQRFFGWPDMAANLVGAAAGIALGTGAAALFRRFAVRSGIESAPSLI